MYTRNFRSVLAAVAIATSLGSAPTLYAADDPISLDDGAAPTCSSGTNSVCRTSTESTTTCLEWVPVSANGSVSPGGGGLGITLQCKTTKVTSTTLTYSWSK